MRSVDLLNEVPDLIEEVSDLFNQVTGLIESDLKPLCLRASAIMLTPQVEKWSFLSLWVY